MTEREPGTDTREMLVDQVRLRRERHEKNERERDQSFWQSVGMMGTVGWSVSLPLTLGALFGRWLDRRLGSGLVFLVFFMLVGLALGTVTAWRLISERR